MPDVSILIVNWNTSQMLADCLRTVAAQAGHVSYEIIVVDNGSSDGSVAMLHSTFPEVQVIANVENVGFARANNQAIAVAQGRYLLLLNTDAFLHAGALPTLVQFMDTHLAAGGAGCRLLNADGTLQRSCFSFPTLETELWQALGVNRLFPRSRLFGKYNMTYWDFDDCRQVDHVLGACMIIRREALTQIGLLDERFFMYSEEVDLCYRMQEGGWPVYFVPAATATHLWGGTSRKVPNETFLRLYRSRLMFFRKHYGTVNVNLYKAVLFFTSLLRVAALPFAILLGQGQELTERSQRYVLLLHALPAL
jgi:GT2 family glycosyltransferase